MQHEGKAPDETGVTPESPAATAANAASSASAQAGAAPPSEPAGEPAGGLDPAQLRQVIEALQIENDKLRADFETERDSHLRARAEVENVRKRGERERADVARYAITKFAGDVVNVADNFERAIKAVPENEIADNPALKGLLEGVVMTEREFLNALERHGVRRVTPEGELFDPHLHQAVMEVEKPEVPAGSVVQCFQAGYTIEDRVLRPAMVSVARGGAKPAKLPPREDVAAPEPGVDAAQGNEAGGTGEPGNAGPAGAAGDNAG